MLIFFILFFWWGGWGWGPYGGYWFRRRAPVQPVPANTHTGAGTAAPAHGTMDDRQPAAHHGPEIFVMDRSGVIYLPARAST